MLSPNQKTGKLHKIFLSPDHSFLIYFFLKKFFSMPPTFASRLIILWETTSIKLIIAYWGQGRPHQTNRTTSLGLLLTFFFLFSTGWWIPKPVWPSTSERAKTAFVPSTRFSSSFLPLPYISSCTLPSLKIANQTLLFSLVTEQNEAKPKEWPPPLRKNKREKKFQERLLVIYSTRNRTEEC